MLANFLCSTGVCNTCRAAATSLLRHTSLPWPAVMPTMNKNGVMNVELKSPWW